MILVGALTTEDILWFYEFYEHFSLILRKGLKFKSKASMVYKMCLLQCLRTSIIEVLHWIIRFCKLVLTRNQKRHITLSAYSQNTLCILKLLEMIESVLEWRSNAMWHFKCTDPMLFSQKGLVFCIFLGQHIFIFMLIKNSFYVLCLFCPYTLWEWYQEWNYFFPILAV